MSQQYVYRFGGGFSMAGTGIEIPLGGKGANLAEMASIDLPVPAVLHHLDRDVRALL
ncbi:hypothetical protein AB5I41_03520 [Sphingomonas sp. MMS24-JH45]